ncbi:MAG: acyl-CoA thioesterase [Myxococcales bacterium]|nr:acyl-CoA thioesterase [Myxococcales bacterium]
MTRFPRQSRCEMTEVVLPGDANALGTIFGGKLMQWVDIAASVAAMRHCGRPVVTASIDALHFLEPVRVGEVVVIQAQVNESFRTSMEVGVRVEVEDPRQPGQRRYTTKAYLTFVALDEEGRPTPVPPVTPENEEDLRRQHEARARRQARQAMRRGHG